MIDIHTASVKDVLPLGVKSHLRGQPVMEQYPFAALPMLGHTEAINPANTNQRVNMQSIYAGGFSGLWFEGVSSQLEVRRCTINPSQNRRVLPS